MTHPMIWTHGVTQTASRPLIMFIGREADEHGDVEVGRIGVGRIDGFRGWGVWGNAYKQIARIWTNDPINFQESRALLTKHGDSPIVFANSLPTCQLNSARKEKVRLEQVPRIPPHIAEIFRASLVRRVRIVIHHGLLGASRWEGAAVDAVRGQCFSNNIPYIRTAFLSPPGNQEQIHKDLSEKRREICEILDNYR